MSEREYLSADREVIGLVNRGHGSGGELPSVVVPDIALAGACLICWLLGQVM